MREIYGLLRLANPFGHPSQVRTQVVVLQTCVDLRVRLARALNNKLRPIFCGLYINIYTYIYPSVTSREDALSLESVVIFLIIINLVGGL